MRSQELFTLMQSAREIKVAVETDGDRVGGLLNEKHPLPVGEGEAAFDYRQHMVQLSNQLDVAVDDAVVEEDAHSDQMIRVSRAVEERNEVADRGYGALVSARQGFEGLFERGGFELVSISGATPHAPRRVVDQLGQSVKLLRRPAVAQRHLQMKGFSVNLDEVADELESEQKALNTAIHRVDAANKKAEGTLLSKNETNGELRRVVVWAGRTVEGLFHLAGEDELAERIRTSTARRPERPSQGTEEASEPLAAESSAAESSAAESSAAESSAAESHT